MTQTVSVTCGSRVADLSSNEPERLYTKESDLAYRRRLGQFFTPYSIARFMSQWFTGLGGHSAEILDPCAGLGVFERAICEVNSDLIENARFSLWEKDERLAADLAHICERLGIQHAVTAKDFLNEHAWSQSYDAIIANPPYYKHHFIENKQDIRDAISSRAGASFSVQTNIYCWFLIKALSLLKPGGRLAFIIPTEFLNANYGEPVKKYLLQTGYLRHIISVCYRSKTFEDALTTACVLLAENGIEAAERFRFYRADSPDQLDDLPDFIDKCEFIEYEKSELDAKHKWRSFFPGSRRTSTKNAKLVPFAEYGRFSRGIATGANAYFAIRPSVAAAFELPVECLIPCISKAHHAPAKLFTRQDFDALKLADKPVYLFDGEAAEGVTVSRYLRSGRAAGYHERYLTRMRSPWYALEKRQPGRIWVGVFGRQGIRFVWNESDCISLTCFHVFQPDEPGRKFLPILFLYLNSSTGKDLLELQKREYGDGLEKYEPNDINNSLAADFHLLEQADLRRLEILQVEFIASQDDSVQEAAILKEADAIFEAVKLRA